MVNKILKITNPAPILKSNVKNSNQKLFSSPALKNDTVSFGTKLLKSKAELKLQRILNEKIKKHGVITSEMVDKKIARLLFLTSTDIFKNAYAPYSGFRVGGAIISEKGNIYKGVNVENVTYNSNLHGETTAISNMIIHEGADAKLVASATCAEKLNPVTSCGSCRQNIAEVSRTWDTKLITANSLNPEKDEDVVIDTLGEMLPKGFSPSILRGDNIVK